MFKDDERKRLYRAVYDAAAGPPEGAKLVQVWQRPDGSWVGFWNFDPSPEDAKAVAEIVKIKVR